jgi:hypothetical protein
MHRIIRNRRTTGKPGLPKTQSRSLKSEPNPQQSQQQDQPKTMLRGPHSQPRSRRQTGRKPRHAAPGAGNTSGTPCRTSRTSTLRACTHTERTATASGIAGATRQIPAGYKAAGE